MELTLTSQKSGATAQVKSIGTDDNEPNHTSISILLACPIVFWRTNIPI